LADPPIACYFRLSAQVFLEQSDFVALGEKVLEVIKGLVGPQEKNDTLIAGILG
jgi:hypothetical protein